MEKTSLYLLLVAALLSLVLPGCSVFQQIEKNKSYSREKSGETSLQTSNSLDTGKVVSTRKWTMVPPSINAPDLPKYTPNIQLPADQENTDFEGAFLDMQRKYNDLYNLSKSGWITFEERVSEDKGKSTSTSISNEKQHEKNQESDAVKKKPDTTFLFLGAGVFLMIIGALFIYLISLSRKVTRLINTVK